MSARRASCLWRIATFTRAALLLLVASSDAAPIPESFDSAGADRRAIETLLNTYTTAVSTDIRACAHPTGWAFGTGFPGVCKLGCAGLNLGLEDHAAVEGCRSVEDRQRVLYRP